VLLLRVVTAVSGVVALALIVVALALEEMLPHYLAKSIDDQVTWAKDHKTTAGKLDKSASSPKVARVFLKRP